jgi:hypothetical protein
MTEYVILLPGNESTWENASEEHRQAMYAKHADFAKLLEERGHKISGGNELQSSKTAKTVRMSGDAVQITEGPYAESVEQVTGYYVVDTDDFDDLLQVCGVLAGAEGAVEVRGTVTHT